MKSNRTSWRQIFRLDIAKRPCNTSVFLRFFGLPVKKSPRQSAQRDFIRGSLEIRDYIKTSGGSYCIPPKSNTVEPWYCDYHQYKERYVIEYFFNKLKQFRHIATRYDKLSRNFLSFAFLASAMILLK